MKQNKQSNIQKYKIEIKFYAFKFYSKVIFILIFINNLFFLYSLFFVVGKMQILKLISYLEKL